MHIGLGRFHRSHQAAYLDRLARDAGELEWGVVGVALRSRQIADALRSQRGLYTLVERDAERDDVRVVGSISRCLYGPDDPTAVLDALTDTRTRIVTLTITDGGYGASPHTQTSVFGYIATALDRRRRAGAPAFSVLSCDNMPQNGDAAREAVLAFANLRDRSLARWIEAHATFPSGMVDRITPETSADDRALVADRLGFEDRVPVVTEPFTQWILEDDFADGRPRLEDAGVQFVRDVQPYSLMKTRLLNGTHSAIGYLGHLAGYDRIDDALDDPLLREYVEQLMRDEVAPLLPEVPGIDLAEYRATLMQRFDNPQIADRLTRLCRRGSMKVPANVVPSIVDARRAGRPHALLTLTVAAWLRYLRGVDLQGKVYEVEDPRAPALCPLAQLRDGSPRTILRRSDLFGDLGRDREFANAVTRAYADLDRHGVHAAVSEALAGDSAPALAA